MEEFSDVPRKPKSIMKKSSMDSDVKYVNKAPPPPKVPPLPKPPPPPTAPRPPINRKKGSFPDSSLTISNNQAMEVQRQNSESKLI